MNTYHLILKVFEIVLYLELLKMHVYFNEKKSLRANYGLYADDLRV